MRPRSVGGRKEVVDGARWSAFPFGVHSAELLSRWRAATSPGEDRGGCAGCC